ncbi:hypothetical protein [Pedobacter jeongneungensis]|uniref:hypothetical protein n=1 Tax=Pedobacter jeongneungensis TaxID=947309 RepID=UPI0013B363D6|nr:hypothetical protein [Pedobacter jeongneungensis]
MMEKRQQVAAALEAVEAVGLSSDQLPEKIAAFYDDPVNHPLILVDKKFGDYVLRFELNLDLSEGQLAFSSYTLMLDKKLVMPEHFVSNGIDSLVLDVEMGKVDWSKHNGFGVSSELDGSSEEQCMQRTMAMLYRFGVVDREWDEQGWQRANEMSDALMLKHFKGTALEESIMASVDFRRSTFYDLYPYTPALHASVVAEWPRTAAELEYLSTITFGNQVKNEIMNLNNLQNLQGEMKKLGFPEKMILEMEKQMKSGVKGFNLFERLEGDKSRLDTTLHFKQSTQSDYYYLNKYEISVPTGRELDKGEKAYVYFPDKQKDGEASVRTFSELRPAIDFFKGLEESAKLGVGKSFDYQTEVAMREGKQISFVDQGYRSTFYSEDQRQTFYVDRGEGFTYEQGRNLVQGRSVYRENMISAKGHPYDAWIMLDRDKPRDRSGNLVTRQFTGGYGFDLKAVLKGYKIKELSDAKVLEGLMESMRNGNRVQVSVERDGKQENLFIEPAVRYSQINFFDKEGKSVKREEFKVKKEEGLMQANGKEKSKAKSKSKSVGVGE